MADKAEQTSATLPLNIYSAEQCRQLDSIAIHEFSIPGIRSMKAAGRAAFELLLQCWPTLLASKDSKITIFCGNGNNAGDGYIVAALARQKNLRVVVRQLGELTKLKGDAALAYQFARDSGVKFVAFNSNAAIESGVVVDALLGTGARNEVKTEYKAAIDAINQCGQPVLSIDLPSGLCANTGRVLGAAVKANATITFIGLKRGLLTGAGPEFCGDIYFDDLAVPPEVYEQLPCHCQRADLKSSLKVLRPRAANAHKGDFGHVLVIGGDHGMAGAAAMAAEAAARIGAGLVSVATRATNVAPIIARRPEVMARAVEEVSQLHELLEKATVIVLGPGLGQSEWSRRMFSAAMAAKKMLVVDADGLNLLAKGGVNAEHNWILTPHPGEAARLLGCDTGVINNDRFAAAQNLLSRFGGVAILKGAGTIIASNDSELRLAVADVGNPGMASGGMGDVLSGVLGGLLAQGLSLKQAAELGVLLHGTAADKAVEHAGERGLLATDLMPQLRRLVNGLF